MICAICGKKQNFLIEDFAFNTPESEHRICVKCEKMRKQLSDSQSEDAINYFKTALQSGKCSEDLVDFVEGLLLHIQNGAGYDTFFDMAEQEKKTREAEGAMVLEGKQHKKLIVKDDSLILLKGETLVNKGRRKIIPIANVSGVEIKEPGPLVAGYIQIQIAGQTSGNSTFKFTGGAYDAALDENAVLFDSDECFKIAEEIQHYIITLQSKTPGGAPTTQTAQPLSGADEILKYKQLMDAGIITAEEFEAKKKQLLGL